MAGDRDRLKPINLKSRVLLARNILVILLMKGQIEYSKGGSEELGIYSSELLLLLDFLIEQMGFQILDLGPNVIDTADAASKFSSMICKIPLNAAVAFLVPEMAYQLIWMFEVEVVDMKFGLAWHGLKAIVCRDLLVRKSKPNCWLVAFACYQVGFTKVKPSATQRNSTTLQAKHSNHPSGKKLVPLF
jgi:hypothetical protein